MNTHQRWVLEKIKLCEARCLRRPNSRLATHRNIWAGVYDVIGCEQDKIDMVEIPKAIMKDTEEAGLITSEVKTVEGKHKTYKFDVWSITELGEKLLAETAQ